MVQPSQKILASEEKATTMFKLERQTWQPLFESFGLNISGDTGDGCLYT